MQRVAAELNLSETAFAHPRADGDWALRWFTPTVEVDLCGHATLATAHVLHGDGLASGRSAFHTRSGVLTAAVGERITLDFPASPVTAASVDLSSVLGAEPAEVHHVAALRELLAVFEDEQTVRTLAPDLAAVARLEDSAASSSRRPVPTSTSSPASSSPPPASPKTRSRAARTPRWPRSGPSDWDATTSSATRRAPAAAWSACGSGAIASS